MPASERPDPQLHAQPRPRAARALLLACFAASGFTALLYQTVWMRLALAKFGVNTSIASTVLAVFMLGLAAGTVGAARLLRFADARFGVGPLRVYGAAELVVAAGGFAVPALLGAGRGALLAAGPESGGLYTVTSALLLALILLPFCAAMGLTFPAAVAFLRSAGASTGASGENRLPFSALYVANVAGALAGAVATPLFLVELFGFLATCRGAAMINVAIAAAALATFAGTRLAPAPTPTSTRSKDRTSAGDATSRARRAALFVTGFSTMGMEVVWMRVYPTVIGTFVYSFATIVATYLLATTIGSAVYRRLRGADPDARTGAWFPWLGAAALLPLLSASTAFAGLNSYLRVGAGVAPFCALLGFITPALVDREAGDDAERVGRAYGINLLGCLLGPPIAGFVLLPVLDTRVAAVLIALPLFLVLALPTLRRGRVVSPVAAVVAAAVIVSSTSLFEDRFPKEQVRRDHVGTVVAGGTGQGRILYVNGVGMTVLTSVTKMMAHFPAAHLARKDGRPLDALVICFGMGTSFRSLASWGANVTAVELVPSVPEMFGYFHPDGPELVRASGGRLRIVVDDGRRFLDRTHASYDLITIDPPPPVEAAGSSLLYSKEFYASAKRRMKPGALLQQWLPEGDRETVAGVVLAVLESFPHVHVYKSIKGEGYHITASDEPLPSVAPEELAARMPEAAVRDMTEWLNAPPAEFFRRMLAQEYDVNALLVDGRREATLAISDDRPVNEFYLVRRHARSGK